MTDGTAQPMTLAAPPDAGCFDRFFDLGGGGGPAGAPATGAGGPQDPPGIGAATAARASPTTAGRTTEAEPVGPAAGRWATRSA